MFFVLRAAWGEVSGWLILNMSPTSLVLCYFFSGLFCAFAFHDIRHLIRGNIAVLKYGFPQINKFNMIHINLTLNLK